MGSTTISTKPGWLVASLANGFKSLHMFTLLWRRLTKMLKPAQYTILWVAVSRCLLQFEIKKLKDVQVETCLKLGGVHYLENLGKPHLLCGFCRNQVCKFCRWKHVLHVNFWSDQYDQVACFSVFHLFVPLPACMSMNSGYMDHIWS